MHDHQTNSDQLYQEHRPRDRQPPRLRGIPAKACLDPVAIRCPQHVDTWAERQAEVSDVDDLVMSDRNNILIVVYELSSIFCRTSCLKPLPAQH